VAESALIVRVPEVERFVRHLRERHDPSASLGVPAHITVLFPFAPPDAIEPSDLALLRAMVESTNAFRYRLARVERFPGVVYLAPQPAAPFVELSARVCAGFPAYPPYGGRHSSSIPHLTVAHGDEALLGPVHAELNAVIADIAGVDCHCDALNLIENSSGRWRQMNLFPLAASATPVT